MDPSHIMYGTKRYTLTQLGDTIDFDRMSKDYDGLELFILDDYCNLHDGMFYTWDCDSIVIWNPYVVNVCK